MATPRKHDRPDMFLCDREPKSGPSIGNKCLMDVDVWSQIGKGKVMKNKLHIKSINVSVVHIIIDTLGL